MNHPNAQVVGRVEYRKGDGPKALVPPGPVEIEKTEHDVTLAWDEGDTRNSAAIPLDEFQRYEREGAIST
jgi:hypothetical protein